MGNANYATVLVLAGLVGCSDQAREQPVEEEQENRAANAEVDPPSAIDSQSSGQATMVIRSDTGQRSFELNHVIAYRVEYQLAGPPTEVSTWVSLTPDPIDPAEIQAQLDANQNDLMEAKPYFPQPPFVLIEIDKDGRLRQLSCYAEDYSSVWVGPALTAYGVEQQLDQNDGRIQGVVKVPPGRNEELSLDCQLDVALFTN